MVEWIASDWRRTVKEENALAKKLGLKAGELLLDYPAKTEMLGLNLPVLRRNGTIEQLTRKSAGSSINLPKLSEDLYQSARWLRAFTAKPVALDRKMLIGLLA